MERKGDLAKEKIIQKSIELFSKQGYDGTSVQQIADACGLSQTNVFYHFGSKRKLFEQIVHKVISHNREIIAKFRIDKHNKLTNLNKFIQGNVYWAYKYSHEFQIIMLLLYFSNSSPIFKKVSTQIYENAARMVADLIDVLKEQNISRSNKSSLDLARIIQQYINGVQYQVVARNDGKLVMENYQKNLPFLLDSILDLDHSMV